MFNRRRSHNSSYSRTHRASSRSPISINKITFLTIAMGFISAIILMRLFQLQVLAHDHYQNIATQSQYGFGELPAQRGEILIRDHHGDEEFLLATNTTLNLLYADPALIKDPSYVSRTLAPLLFDLETARATENERLNDIAKNLAPDLTEEERNNLLKAATDDELASQFQQELYDKISAKKRPQLTLRDDLPEETLAEITRLGLPGIAVSEGLLYAYPPQISNPASVAESLSALVEIPSKRLAQLLKGENRYVVLKKKLQPAVSEQIIDYMEGEQAELFHGLGMQEEYFRFYPEGSLAANLVGYTDHRNIGQYGIESSFNTALQGVAGKLQTKRDSIGRQITVGESVLSQAVDGADVLLTIDRSVQLKIEKILKEDTLRYNADSGQILVMNPQTGAIIAAAHYPSFNPNSYGDVFGKTEIFFTPEEIENLYETDDEDVFRFYTNAITLDYYTVFKEIDDDGNTHFFRYENFVGPEVYHNKIVSWPYEPGSVFKTVAMAIAIDDGDLTPNSTYNDYGPVGVDFNKYTGKYDFEIKNSEGYYGLVNMTTVLGKSLNTGMTYLAKTIGPALFYNYIEKFGFLDRTDIEFDSETTGKIRYFEDWTESELATTSFGQGMTVTMIQLVNAYSAIINGGVLMQPYIVAEIRHDDGTVTTTEPHEIRRVISEDTSNKMVAMLKESVETGVANNAQVPYHYVGGKTGTSQTYKHGRALSGVGTTITSFAGFGPVNNPQFVILVKYDRPKASEWGSSTAAPTFKRVAEYLFNYYNIPPDKDL